MSSILSSTSSLQTAPVESNRSTPWTVEKTLSLYELPLMDLVWQSHSVHRRYFDPNEIQRSALLSIKTGGCSENCGYCSQSAHHDTEVERQPLMAVADVVAAARAAKEKGASRFCMGAAWRGPRERDLERVADMVREVKALGLETCATLGILNDGQAEVLKGAGLDYYNHNLDTDADYYDIVVGTHRYQDRLETIDKVRNAGIKVCSGGIIGMGESRRNRAALLVKLANMATPPESVPINRLVPIPGTPMAEQPGVDDFELLRTIAVGRLMMPTSFIRLSAGRQEMSEEAQAFCFFAGANSLFYGDDLLTTENVTASNDDLLFAKIGLRPI